MGAYYKTVKAYATPANIKNAYTIAKTVAAVSGKLRKTATFSQKVKKIVHKTEVTQYKLSNQSKNMLNSSIVTMCPTTNITIGTGDYNRLADNIYLSSCSLNLIWHPPVATSTIFLRIMAVWSDLDLAACNANDLWADSGLTYGDLFRQTGSNFPPTAFHNNNNIMFALDRTIAFVPATSTQQDTKLIKLNLKLAKPFKYTVGTNFSSKKNLYFCMVANQNGGTDGVTALGSVYSQFRLAYKNAAN